MKAGDFIITKGRRERVYDAIAAGYERPRLLGAWIIAYGIVVGTAFGTIAAGPMVISTLIESTSLVTATRNGLDFLLNMLAIPAFMAAFIAVKFVLAGLVFVVFGPALMPRLKHWGERTLARRRPRVAEIDQNLTDDERRHTARRQYAVIAWTAGVYAWGALVFAIGFHLPEGAFVFLGAVVVIPAIATFARLMHWSIMGQWRFYAQTEYARAQGWTLADIKPPFLPKALRRTP